MAKTSIFQIYYRPEQLATLDPAFRPYDNIANPCPEWCEYHVFRTEHAKGTTRQYGLTGFVSWKFREKTGLKGRQFLNFIDSQPGMDVYIVNPFQGIHTQLANIWYHGARWHPGMMEVVQSIFTRVYPEYRLDVFTMLNPAEDYAFCNYWAATPEFWDRYIAFCEPMFDYIEHHATDAEKQALAAKTVDAAHDLSFRPYIMERMLTTLLWLARHGRVEPIRSATYDLQDEVDQRPLSRTRNILRGLTPPEPQLPTLLSGLEALKAYEDQYDALHDQKAEDYRLFTQHISELDAELARKQAYIDQLTAERDRFRDERNHLQHERDLLSFQLAARLQHLLNEHPGVTKALKPLRSLLKRPG